MARKNRGICHSCRSTDHLFADCPNKQVCTWCQHAFIKCFEVEKALKNKGKLFKCCEADCGYWKWLGDGESSGNSSTSIVKATTPTMKEAIRDVSDMLESLLQLNDEQEVNISLNLTIHKGKASSKGDEKRKERVRLDYNV
ncbi:uncharacterized protein LOC111394498 [Olea europaea var. sylvestris]|uniref:uncharacterized protein LOC111394498 n=1 Tax=Olea europaea var. sylvestris TaxID=158386 RepID=UPI000C1D1D0D|nr:uncharacterized protein LOC111394498 [Olea europaea var. sylvestris]